MKKKELIKNGDDWIQKKWRPMMAVMYMVVCIFDFVLFPIGYTIVQFWEFQPENDQFRQWVPITLGGGGLFHVAMGAVLGVTAWSRGQEKIAGVATTTGGSFNENNSLQRMPTTSSLSSSGRYDTSSGYNYAATAYRSTPDYRQEPVYTGYEQTRETFTATPVVSGYKGKKAPVQPEDPEI